jgi:hypothetical protein
VLSNKSASDQQALRLGLYCEYCMVPCKEEQKWWTIRGSKLAPEL